MACSLTIKTTLAMALFAVATFGAYANEPTGLRYRQAAFRAGTSPLEKDAYLELSNFHLIRSLPSGLPGSRATDPVSRLHDLGLDVLPVLTEALDDFTPTRAYHYSRAMPITRTTPYAVSDIAGVAICAVAERQFYFNGRSIQEVSRARKDVPQFRKMVMDWYAANRSKPLAQRMIEDVEDADGDNRHNAIEWLGRHKDAGGKDAIIKHVNRILDLAPAETAHALALGQHQPFNGPFGYLGASGELAAAAVALGRIRGADSETTVRRICKEFSRCVEQYHFEGYDFRIDHLFEGYRGLIALGKRDEAINELERLFKDCSPAMSSNDRDRYQRKLAIARKWTGDDRDLLIMR